MMDREFFLHYTKKLFSEKILPRLKEEADRGRWKGVKSSMFQLSIYEDRAWIELSYIEDGFYSQIVYFEACNWTFRETYGRCHWTYEDKVFMNLLPFMSAFACYDFKNLAEKKETRDVLDRTNEDLIHKMLLVLEENFLLAEGTGIRAYLGDCVPEAYEYIDAYIEFLDIVLPLLPTPKEKYEQLLEISKPFKIIAEKLSLELK